MKPLGQILSLFGDLPTAHGARLPTRRELQREWRLRRSELIELARRAAENAYHYGNPPKKYGTAILAYREAEEPSNRVGVFTGSNRTWWRRPKDAPWEKPCAEQEAKYAAFALGFQFIWGVVNYSDNMQHDDISGVWCDVPYPCLECRQRLEAHLSRDTPFILVRRRSPVELNPPAGDYFIREPTFGDILRTHAYREQR